MGINLQRLTHEIHEMQQLHKMPESSDYTVYDRVTASIDAYT